MRGVIATRMHASLQEMAQLTLGTDATMDAAMALRAQLKEQWQQAGMPVPTITDLVVRAAALALREHPRLNASVHDNAIHVQPEINVGLAVALEEGLMVPVLKRADQLPLSSLAAESRRLARGRPRRPPGPGRARGRHVHRKHAGQLRHRLLHSGNHPGAGRDPGRRPAPQLGPVGRQRPRYARRC